MPPERADGPQSDSVEFETGGQPTNAEFEHYGSDWRPGIGPQSISVIHDLGDDACGGVAFYATERPRRAEVVSLDTVRLLDDSQPSAATLMVCGSCGRMISPGNVTPEGGYA